MTHTPTPWRIDGDESERIYRISAPTAEDEFDYIMCNEAYYPHAPDRPTAAFIVRAVNAHESLIAELRQVHTELEEAAKLLSGAGLRGMSSIYAAASERVIAALAKAEAA